MLTVNVEIVVYWRFDEPVFLELFIDSCFEVPTMNIMLVFASAFCFKWDFTYYGWNNLLLGNYTKKV